MICNQVGCKPSYDMEQTDDLSYKIATSAYYTNDVIRITKFEVKDA